jgi:hypothetical protein
MLALERRPKGRLPTWLVLQLHRLQLRERGE